MVVSLDNMNGYYEVSLKEWRLSRIEEAAADSRVKHMFVKGSIVDKELLDRLFAEYKFDIVVNLAAQAGVRYSIVLAYVSSQSTGQREGRICSTTLRPSDFQRAKRSSSSITGI